MLVSELADVCEETLYSLAETRAKMTSLSEPADTASVNLRVSDGQLVDRGFVEIGYELIQVSKVDRNSGRLTVLPRGRGARGTTPAVHLLGDTVTVNPAFPRSGIVREINDAVRSLYPTLFRTQRIAGISLVEPPDVTPLPEWMTGVADVRAVTPDGREHPVNRYRLRDAPGGGLLLEILECIPREATLTLTGIGHFAVPLRPEDDLTTVGGVLDEWTDIVRLRVCSVLAASMDFARLRTDSIEAGGRADRIQPVSASQVSKSWMQYYQLRKQEARNQLLNSLNGRARFTY
ncbi:hypothetical protein [Streptomyces hydrogenans]|uniref:hypothetical protein n=1 Tax=Streptomyces hydrogenans TaxID=1873719 RepID=UPI0035D6BEB6